MRDVIKLQRRTASGLEDVLSFGDIVASGSNANGEWVRWNDGTQICWGSKTITLTSSQQGGINKMTYDGVMFPAVFANLPTCSVCVDWATLQYAWANCHRRYAGQFNLSVYSINVFTNQDITISFLAIGKWK